MNRLIQATAPAFLTIFTLLSSSSAAFGDVTDGVLTLETIDINSKIEVPLELTVNGANLHYAGGSDGDEGDIQSSVQLTYNAANHSLAGVLQVTNTSTATRHFIGRASIPAAEGLQNVTLTGVSVLNLNLNTGGYGAISCGAGATALEQIEFDGSSQWLRYCPFNLAGSDGPSDLGTTYQLIPSVHPILVSELSYVVNMSLTPGETATFSILLAFEGSPIETGCGPEDLNFDGVVDNGDLGLLLADWGTNTGPSDLDGSGIVDGKDLGILLGAFGNSCLAEGAEMNQPVSGIEEVAGPVAVVGPSSAASPTQLAEDAPTVIEKGKKKQNKGKKAKKNKNKKKAAGKRGSK